MGLAAALVRTRRGSALPLCSCTLQSQVRAAAALCSGGRPARRCCGCAHDGIPIGPAALPPGPLAAPPMGLAAAL
eukprot:13514034-Alexandrium_andersonii.AAC.1